MLPEYFTIVGVLITVFGSIAYLIDTLRGRVKPNKVTWFLWAIGPLIAFAAEVKQGGGIQTLFTFTVGFMPLLILAASFVNKKSHWKIERRDIICGGLSLLGLLLWYVTKVGDIAIACSIIGDAFAAYPTILKSFYTPESESPLAYFTSAISGAITLLTIHHWTFTIFGFPLYIVIANTLLFILIQFKVGKLLRK